MVFMYDEDGVKDGHRHKVHCFVARLQDLILTHANPDEGKTFDVLFQVRSLPQLLNTI